jgi:dihydropyrimidinase
MADRYVDDVLASKLVHRLLIELERKDKLEERGMVQPYFHALSRPPIVEGEATDHVTKVNQLGMDNIRRAQGKGLPVYGETCPQYLNLTWDDLVRF